MGVDELLLAIEPVREGLRRGAQTGASLHSPGWTGDAAQAWERQLERACAEQRLALAAVGRLREAVLRLRAAAALASAGAGAGG